MKTKVVKPTLRALRFSGGVGHNPSTQVGVVRESGHQGEKPHPCADCGKNFSQKADLFLHIRTVHNGEKPHVCPVCGRGFGQSVALTRHIRAVHEGPKTLTNVLIAVKLLPVSRV